MYRTFSDRYHNNAEGPAKYWYDDGTLKEVGRFANDERAGDWKEYHDNGQLEATGAYTDGKRGGDWLYYDDEGALIQKSAFTNGEKNGITYYYTADGVVAREATFAEGELVSEVTLLDPDPTRNANSLRKAIEVMPLFPGCEETEAYDERKQCAEKALLYFIYGNIRYPERSRQQDVEGMAVISFVVEKNGSISNEKVIRGLNSDITAELYRIVKMMPNWSPGMVQGEPVRVSFNLPVRFKLE